MKTKLTRREFVIGGAAGVAAGLILPRCGPLPQPPAGADGSGAGPADDPDRSPTGGARSFPYLELAGAPREVGRGIGRFFGDFVRTGIERRAEWFAELRQFATGEGRPAVETMLAAASKHTPRAVAELQGWAEGAELPFADLLTLNLQAELAALMKARATPAAPMDEAHPGCSTIVQRTADGIWHLHNEDGADVYADLMFLTHVRPDAGPSYLALNYPGILTGNAPVFNSAGVVQTTNFIGTDDVRLGVGRYFLDRMALESRSLEEALEWSSHPERAYAFHHVFTSIPKRRSVAIEVTPSKRQVLEIEGRYIHTNHLVLEGMENEAQDAEYVGASSRNRWMVLSEWAASVSGQPALGRDELLAPLASHERRPYSPCRHPDGDVHGFTLATAVFAAPAGTMRLYKHQPCHGDFAEYELPAP